MVLWVKHLPHKHEDLSFGPQNTNKDGFSNSTSVIAMSLWPQERLRQDSSLKPVQSRKPDTEQRTRDPFSNKMEGLGLHLKLSFDFYIHPMAPCCIALFSKLKHSP